MQRAKIRHVTYAVAIILLYAICYALVFPSIAREPGPQWLSDRELDDCKRQIQGDWLPPEFPVLVAIPAETDSKLQAMSLHHYRQFKDTGQRHSLVIPKAASGNSGWHVLSKTKPYSRYAIHADADGDQYIKVDYSRDGWEHHVGYYEVSRKGAMTPKYYLLYQERLGLPFPGLLAALVSATAVALAVGLYEWTSILLRWMGSRRHSCN